MVKPFSDAVEALDDNVYTKKPVQTNDACDFKRHLEMLSHQLLTVLDWNLNGKSDKTLPGIHKPLREKITLMDLYYAIYLSGYLISHETFSFESLSLVLRRQIFHLIYLDQSSLLNFEVQSLVSH